MDIQKNFGSMGLRKHLPYLTQKIIFGNNEEKMVTLDLFDRIDFDAMLQIMQQYIKELSPAVCIL